jgi:hypothetical protein
MHDGTPTTLTRLRELLDAYGASPERWPPEEREAACALLAQSPEAQRCREASVQLDAVLNLAAAPEPSSALLEDILAAAGAPGSADGPASVPASRPPLTRGAQLLRVRPSGSTLPRSRTWRRIATALPLAAAAGFVLWVLYRPTSAPEVPSITIAEIGVYDAPTDALLTTFGMNTFDSIPSFGCASVGLGCLDVEPIGDQSALNRET